MTSSKEVKDRRLKRPGKKFNDDKLGHLVWDQNRDWIILFKLLKDEGYFMIFILKIVYKVLLMLYYVRFVSTFSYDSIFNFSNLSIYLYIYFIYTSVKTY